MTKNNDPDPHTGEDKFLTCIASVAVDDVLLNSLDSLEITELGVKAGQGNRTVRTVGTMCAEPRKKLSTDKPCIIGLVLTPDSLDQGSWLVL